jgi:hypothetical protein
MDSGQDIIYQRTLLGKPSYRFESCPDYKRVGFFDIKTKI